MNKKSICLTKRTFMYVRIIALTIFIILSLFFIKKIHAHAIDIEPYLEWQIEKWREDIQKYGATEGTWKYAMEKAWEEALKDDSRDNGYEGNSYNDCDNRNDSNDHDF